MNDNSHAPTSSTEGQPKRPGLRIDRRALLRGGVGATPVLLTLVSNPVSAANSCMVASSFVSVTTFKSRNPTSNSISCGAKSLADWRAFCQANATCGTATVKATLGKGGSYEGYTLRQMLMNYSSTTGPEGLLRHLAAMYLTLTQTGGLKSGWSQGNLSVAELQKIWSQCKNGGNYSPSGSGVNWNTTQVIQWLEYQLNYTIPF